MNRSDQDRLLRELLNDNAVERLRTESLACGVATLRRRRMQRIAITGVATMLALIATLAVWRPQRTSEPIAVPSPSSAPAPAQPKTPSVRFINDDQLLALFPNRSVALVGRPGEQKLMFLDVAAPRAK